jgi:hypothetical protein
MLFYCLHLTAARTETYYNNFEIVLNEKKTMIYFLIQYQYDNSPLINYQYRAVLQATVNIVGTAVTKYCNTRHSCKKITFRNLRYREHWIQHVMEKSFPWAINRNYKSFSQKRISAT